MPVRSFGQGGWWCGFGLLVFVLFGFFFSPVMLFPWWHLRNYISSTNYHWLTAEVLRSHTPIPALLVLFLLSVLTVAKNILQIQIDHANFMAKSLALWWRERLFFRLWLARSKPNWQHLAPPAWWEALLLYSRNLLLKRHVPSNLYSFFIDVCLNLSSRWICNWRHRCSILQKKIISFHCVLP